MSNPTLTPSSSPNLSGPPSQLVVPLHTERKMKIYGVTDNELRTITIVNAAVAALFSLGTGCFGYLLNLRTDEAFAGTLPPATVSLMQAVQLGLFAFGVAFYVLGLVAWIMRGGFIATIKRESDPSLRVPRTRGYISNLWAAIKGEGGASGNQSPQGTG